MTHEYVFDYHDGDVFWCTADVGWVTGHSYIVYGPLANGATTLMFEGVPNYPDASRFWQVVDKHKVNTFYTAPTAIRALMGEGDEFVARTVAARCKLLGTVGEPINPEAWRWYHEVVGERPLPDRRHLVADRNGRHMISPLPGATALKPGSATKPLPRRRARTGRRRRRESGRRDRRQPRHRRQLAGTDATVYGAITSASSRPISPPIPANISRATAARRDADGYYWITGRVDDVINVSGHRMGTAEVESALVLHPEVAEAAVVGYAARHQGPGHLRLCHAECGDEPSEALRKELVAWVRKEIGPIAAPDMIQFAPGLPKTRSGKIMRRILRKIAEGDVSSLGDTSTLADPSVVDDLVANRVA